MEAKQLKESRYNGLEMAAFYAMWFALFFHTIYLGWVSEDAYITFRVIENFFNGDGLRWNVYERVQAYTHPLWMLIHLPVYALWNNLFMANVVVSVVCVSATAFLLMYTGQRSVLMTLVFLYLPLFASGSFMDYTSSGLENPLSYLLFACFCYVVLKKYEHSRFWLYISFTVALALLNRLDCILLYGPALLYLALQRKPVNVGQVIQGSLPLLAWFAFSLFYYGFIFPNTKYAKLNTGMDLLQYVSQGVHYAKYLFIWDTAGAVIILSALVFLLPKRLVGWITPPVSLPQLPMWVALGIFTYCLYVVYIGGDYMAGRFWALPVFCTVCLWYFFTPPRIRLDIMFTVLCVLGVAYYTPRMLHEIRRNCEECIELKGRVINARPVFLLNRWFGEVYPLRMRTEGHYLFAAGGRRLKEENPDVKKLFYIGMTAYYAGTKIKMIDELGLADPLLARLPASKQQRFYIGHFRRDLPKGYINAVKTGGLGQMHPSLAKYYEKLRLIVSGDLLDKERLKTIILFNLGYYDHLKDDYLLSLESTKKKEEPPAKAK